MVGDVLIRGCCPYFWREKCPESIRHFQPLQPLNDILHQNMRTPENKHRT